MVAKSQKFELYDHPSQMEPLLPGELARGRLLELAHDLQRTADRLTGLCRPGALEDLRHLLRSMNSYYSNKIEGQHALPLEIEQALHDDYSLDEDKARRQRLAVAHMATEQRLEEQWRAWSEADVWSERMVRDIHQDLFARLPEEDRRLPEGDVLQPGALRDRDVSVGIHAAPSFKVLDAMLQRWGSFYRDVRRGELRIVAACASHQRLAWIHPFRDGNGRVARLHTHLAFGQMGLTNGLWSPITRTSRRPTCRAPATWTGAATCRRKRWSPGSNTS
jgi:Fic family protein